MALPYKIGFVSACFWSLALVLLAVPAPGWQDGGELAAAAATLGVPHPGGFPPLPTLGRLLTLLPLGPMALRCALVSVIATVATLALLAGLTTNLALELGADRGPAAASGLLTALLLGSAEPILQSATEIEAYAPSLLTVALVLCLASRAGRDARDAGLGGFAFGLGAATHAVVRLVGLPPLLVVLSPWRRRPGAVALALAAAALGLSVVVALPLMSLRDPPLDWGDPQTWSAFCDHVTAGRIRRAFADRMLSTAWLPSDASRFGDLALDEVGLFGLALACLGLGVGLRRTRAAAAALGAVALLDLAYAVAVNPMGIEDRQVGHGFLAALTVLIGLGVAAPSLVAPGRRWATLLTLALSVLALAPRADLDERWSSDPWIASAVVGDALAGPPRAVVLCESDALCGGLAWAQIAEGDRPDIIALPRQHLWDGGMVRARLARHASAVELPEGRRLDPAAVLRALHAAHPVTWERGSDRALLASLGPSARLGTECPAPLFRVGGSGGSSAEIEARARDALRRWTGGRRPRSRYARRGLAAVLEAHAVAASEAGDAEAIERAEAVLEAALELEPSASAWINRSALAVRRDDLDAARRALARALEIEPTSPRALAALGRLELAEAHDEAARRAFERARALCPTRCGAPLGGLGILAARAGEYDAARALMTEALLREPGLRDVRINLRLLDRVAPAAGDALPSTHED